MGSPVCNGNFSGGTQNVLSNQLYLDVVASGCRSCHMSFTGNEQFNTYAKFAALSGQVGTGADDAGYGVGGKVCTTGEMPNSSVTSTNFWRSNGPHSPTTLSTFSQPTTLNVDSPQWYGGTTFGTCAPP